MKLVGEYQLEVTQIVIRKNALLNKRIIDTFARTIFFADIEDTGEYSYRVENNYVKCGLIIKKNGEWINVKETKEELQEAVKNWYAKPENISNN